VQGGSRAVDPNFDVTPVADQVGIGGYLLVSGWSMTVHPDLAIAAAFGFTARSRFDGLSERRHRGTFFVFEPLPRQHAPARADPSHGPRRFPPPGVSRHFKL